MTVTDVQRDLEQLTLTIVSEFAASPDRLWQIWADPRQLERWWGPPTHPATFVEHDFTVGGLVSYFMTGPEGEKYGGWWRIEAVEPPNRLAFTDGFADDNGEPDDSLPTTRAEIAIEQIGDGRTRMTILSRFDTIEAMEQTLAMGAEEGLSLALGQIDELLDRSVDPAPRG